MNIEVSSYQNIVLAMSLAHQYNTSIYYNHSILTD